MARRCQNESAHFELTLQRYAEIYILQYSLQALFGIRVTLCIGGFLFLNGWIIDFMLQCIRRPLGICGESSKQRFHRCDGVEWLVGKKFSSLNLPSLPECLFGSRFRPDVGTYLRLLALFVRRHENGPSDIVDQPIIFLILVGRAYGSTGPTSKTNNEMFAVDSSRTG